MQDVNFYVYNKDELLSHVIVKDNHVSVENFTKSRLFTPFLIDNVTTTTVIQFFKNRCFEPTRPDKRELLQRLGLETYNAIEIVKKTHGMMAEDYCWVKFAGEDISYEELFRCDRAPQQEIDDYDEDYDDGFDPAEE